MSTDTIEKLARINRERLTELEQARLQLDLAHMQLQAANKIAQHALATAQQTQAHWAADEIATVLKDIVGALKGEQR